jgi:hypothetical protein
VALDHADPAHVLLERDPASFVAESTQVLAANESACPGGQVVQEGERSGPEPIVLVLPRSRTWDVTLTTPMTSENDLRDALAREMYWAEEATPRSRMDIGDVRDALHDFATLMRDDEKQTIPRGEPNLASTSRWRRQLKFRLFRLFRPISWRYDRLLADLGELNAALADRVAVLEAEVERLRRERAER